MKKLIPIIALTLVIGILILNTVLVSAFDLTDLGLKQAGSYDFNGEIVIIISWTSERMANYFDDHVAVRGRVQEAKELFNCKIEWLQTRDIPGLCLNRPLASESVNDLWHVQNQMGYFQLAAAGALYPIEEVITDA